VWRWTLPIALLVGAVAATAGWARWLPIGPSPATEPAAAIAAQPLPVAPPQRSLPPQFVTLAATKSDRTLVQRATRLLRAHGALAPQRTAEIRRQHLTPIAELEVSACDVCRAEALTSPDAGASTIGGRTVCEMTLNTPFARKQAMRARVPSGCCWRWRCSTSRSCACAAASPMPPSNALPPSCTTLGCST